MDPLSIATNVVSSLHRDLSQSRIAKLITLLAPDHYDFPRSCQRPERHMEPMEARARYRAILLFPAQTQWGFTFAAADTTARRNECCARGRRFGRYARYDSDKLSRAGSVPSKVRVEDHEGRPW